VVDHRLQPGSDTVAAQAARQAESHGIDAEVVAVDVDCGGIGVEAAARDARHAALREGPEALILLAHTLDDQAETVLLGLARGSGARSLAGMAPRRDRLVRPFLTVRRTDTEQACRDWNLTWWTDPTNDDPAYTRSRLRRAMGLLEQSLGPALRENLARTADLCRADADFLDQLAGATGLVTFPAPGAPPTDDQLPTQDLAALPGPIRHRVLLAWLREIGREAVTREHVLAVDSLVTDWHGQKSITVPGGQIARENGMLRRGAATP
jgi:tRNA(Ile)-lysidine synthase